MLDHQRSARVERVSRRTEIVTRNTALGGGLCAQAARFDVHRFCERRGAAKQDASLHQPGHPRYRQHVRRVSRFGGSLRCQSLGRVGRLLLTPEIAAHAHDRVEIFDGR